MTKICLNAGHCIGKDSGAVGNGRTEAQETLNICNDVAKYLKPVGYDVLVVQEHELKDVCKASDNFNADAFISIHLNAFNGTAKGTETHYFSMEGAKLAQATHTQLAKSFPTTDRGIKKSGFFVLRNTDAVACLVEVLFIDNYMDMILYDKHYDAIVRAIARGISDYIGGVSFNIEKPIPNYFTEQETACKHCGKNPENGMSKIHMAKLNELRHVIGKPLIISSGYRCPVHNANVGGVPNSEHVKGCATDIIVPDGMTVDQLADEAVKIGFDGIGRYYNDGFVHLDCRDNGHNSNGYKW